MFQIDDQFLANIGYNVATLSDEKKKEYIDEFTAEVNERVSERLVDELTDDQLEEFNDIQENSTRAAVWLDEFHAGYADTPEYKTILDGTGDIESATTFYASALWMKDAVPYYGDIVQEELDNYQQQLINMRSAANSTLSQ